jgi:hypothetical protein
MARQDELIKFPVELVQRGSITHEDLPPHITMGIRAYGASEFVTGCGFDGTVIQRAPYDPITGTPAESVDACVYRAAKQLVPSLPDTAPRDSQGRAIGYLVYSGLSEEHCKPVSNHMV